QIGTQHARSRPGCLLPVGLLIAPSSGCFSPTRWRASSRGRRRSALLGASPRLHAGGRPRGDAGADGWTSGSLSAIDATEAVAPEQRFQDRAQAADAIAAHAASGSCWKERRKRNKASPLNERADILAASSRRLFNASSTPTLSCSRFSSAFRLVMSSPLLIFCTARKCKMLIMHTRSPCQRLR